MNSFLAMCHCGDTTILRASSREDAALQILSVWGKEEIKHHMQLMHPDERAPKPQEVQKTFQGKLVPVS